MGMHAPLQLDRETTCKARQRQRAGRRVLRLPLRRRRRREEMISSACRQQQHHHCPLCVCLSRGRATTPLNYHQQGRRRVLRLPLRRRRRRDDGWPLLLLLLLPLLLLLLLPHGGTINKGGMWHRVRRNQSKRGQWTHYCALNAERRRTQILGDDDFFASPSARGATDAPTRLLPSLQPLVWSV